MADSKDLSEIDKRLRLVELGIKRLEKSIKLMTAELVKTNKELRIRSAIRDGEEQDRESQE